MTLPDQARTLSYGLKIITIVLLTGLLREKALAITEALPPMDWVGLQSALFLAMALPPFWISLIAPILYLTALWSASEVLMRISWGEAFQDAVQTGLRDVGSNLVWGAAAALILQPTLTHWSDMDFRGFYGILYKITVADLTIGLIGATLFVLARLGQKLQSELDSFV